MERVNHWCFSLTLLIGLVLQTGSEVLYLDTFYCMFILAHRYSRDVTKLLPEPELTNPCLKYGMGDT